MEETKIRRSNPETDTVSVRLTTGQIMQIDEFAGRGGITRSDWVKRVIANALRDQSLMKALS